MNKFKKNFIKFLKKPNLIFFICILCFGCASKQNFENINLCIDTKNYEQANIEEFKKILNKKASEKFFNKYKGVSASEIVFANKKYYNTEKLDKLCIEAKIGLKNSSFKKKNEKIKIKNFCLNSKDTKLGDIKDYLSKEALKTQIYSKYPEFKNKDYQIIEKNISNLKISNPSFDFKTNISCINLKADFYPEGVILSDKKQNNNFGFVEDFKGFKPGDKPEIYGKNLVIQQTNEGPGLTTLSKNKAIAEFIAGDLNSGEIKISIIHKNEESIIKKEKFITFLSLEFLNKKKDIIEILFKKDKYNLLISDFKIGKTRLKNIKVLFAKNFNEIKLVKSGMEVKIFFNGKYTGSFYPSGTMIEKISIPVSQDIIVCGIEVSEK
jgi:hypothetical protein